MHILENKVKRILSFKFVVQGPVHNTDNTAVPVWYSGSVGSVTLNAFRILPSTRIKIQKKPWILHYWDFIPDPRIRNPAGSGSYVDILSPLEKNMLSNS